MNNIWNHADIQRWTETDVLIKNIRTFRLTERKRSCSILNNVKLQNFHPSFIKASFRVSCYSWHFHGYVGYKNGIVRLGHLASFLHYNLEQNDAKCLNWKLLRIMPHTKRFLSISHLLLCQLLGEMLLSKNSFFIYFWPLTKNSANCSSSIRPWQPIHLRVIIKFFMASTFSHIDSSTNHWNTQPTIRCILLQTNHWIN